MAAGYGVQEREGCEAVDADAAIGAGCRDDREGRMRRGLPRARRRGGCEGCEGFECIEA